MASFLLINPSSGDGGAAELAAAARARGITVHVLRRGDDLAGLAREADAGSLAIAGGDGSLAPVAEVAIERGLPFDVTGLCVGKNAWFQHLGVRSHDQHTVVPWEAVVRIEGKRIVVRDDATP